MIVYHHRGETNQILSWNKLKVTAKVANASAFMQQRVSGKQMPPDSSVGASCSFQPWFKGQLIITAAHGAACASG
jgi:hypothetical protein